MDIHRCRFVPYPPSTINALAFSHSYISKSQKTASPRLAVGRANGDIEIWNPLNGSWLQETIIRGGKDRSVDGLVWTQDPNEEDANGKAIIGKSRLFSVGYTTTVTEWDLEKGRPLRQASGNHGEIWCLAAQPALQSTANNTNGAQGQWHGQNLMTGCTDGALVLYSTKDDDLQLQRILVRPSSKKAKIISIAFQDRNIVVAGCTDSTIRIYDARNGTNLRNMSLGAGPSGGPKEIIVWSVKILQNGNIVSGDSTGELRIWDGKTYSLTQRIKGHKQDILSLATSFDGSTIFSGGMDRRTVVYRQAGKGKSRWAEVGHRRYHTHDVKAMASFEHKAVSVVVSGGPDASPTVVPLRQFGMENQRSLPFMSQDSPIRSAPRRRLMMSFWDREVHIWRLSKQVMISAENEEASSDNRQLVAKILIKGEASITSAALSEDGNLLVASTATDIKLFHLKPRKSEDNDGLRISKIALPSNLPGGARLVQFSPDGKWLSIVRPDSRLILARLNPSASSVTVHHLNAKLTRLNRHIEKRILIGGLGAYDRTITQTAFSHNSTIFAVSDLAGYIDTWVLSGIEDLTLTDEDFDAASVSKSEESESEEDSEEGGVKITSILGQNWTRNPAASSIAKVPATPTILSFRPVSPVKEHSINGASHVIPTRHNPNPIAHDLPAGEDRLLVVTATRDVFEFEVLKGSLSPWSRRNPTSTFPVEFTKLRDQARGYVWDITESRERLWLYGVGWLWMFDLSRDFPPESPQLTNGESSGKKRKRKGGKEEHSGAGSTIPDKILGTGMSRKMQRVIHDEVDESQEVHFGDADAMYVDDDEDEYPELERLRRGSESGEDRNAEVADGERQEVAEVKPHYWRTFKYRPILGMRVVGECGMGDIGPEVAIVERPIWDADLGPRYVGDQEWERPGVGSSDIQTFEVLAS